MKRYIATQETAQEMKERVEAMINREYADLPASVRMQMIASEFASIDRKFSR